MSMRKITFAVTAMLLAFTMFAQQGGSIKLSSPNKTRGVNIMKALDDRRSTNEYSDKMLSNADLSDLLWAANGINRADEGKRTAASAMNRQDVMVYTFTAEGVHLYDAEKHELTPVAQGDHRKLFGERGMSPVIILLVSDVAKFGDVGTPELRKEFGAIDVGLVSQNIALFCSGNNIGTKPRASMDRDAIKSLLELTDLQFPMLNHSVGYFK